MEFITLGIFIFAAIISIVLGIAVKYFKAYWLISGYNTMSQEKKEHVDTAGLGNLVGNFCFVLAAIMLIAGFFIVADRVIFGLIFLALIVPLSIYVIVNAQKYDANTQNPDGTMNNKTKIIVGSISLMLVGTVIGVGILVYQSNKPVEITIANGYLEIHGLYGEKINIEDIKEISFKDTMPKVNYKSNGSSLGTKKKGNFQLDGVGSAKLFVDDSMQAFVFIETDSKFYILNYIDEEQTKELYNALIGEWKV